MWSHDLGTDYCITVTILRVESVLSVLQCSHDWRYQDSKMCQVSGLNPVDSDVRMIRLNLTSFQKKFDVWKKIVSRKKKSSIHQFSSTDKNLELFLNTLLRSVEATQFSKSKLARLSVTSEMSGCKTVTSDIYNQVGKCESGNPKWNERMNFLECEKTWPQYWIFRVKMPLKTTANQYSHCTAYENCVRNFKFHCVQKTPKFRRLEILELKLQYCVHPGEMKRSRLDSESKEILRTEFNSQIPDHLKSRVLTDNTLLLTQLWNSDEIWNKDYKHCSYAWKNPEQWWLTMTTDRKWNTQWYSRKTG